MRIKLFAGHLIWPAKNLLSLMFLLGSLAAIAQTPSNRIQGTVTDLKGVPLQGVNVLIKNGGSGTITDKEGKYALLVQPGNVLIFSSSGFLNQEEKVGDRTVINVLMQQSSTTLDDVVVVGYGSQKKVNLSGSVAQVTGKDLANRPVANVTGALQGVMPGLTVFRSSGKPGGEGYGIRVRGFSSANDANALVLVDGIEQDLNLIDPSDIESISVLKDASASAIYGARAAAGVILVTTKQAKAGKTQVTLSSNYGVNITARQPKRLNSWDEQTLIDEARLNATGTAEYTAENYEWLKNPNFYYRPNPTQGRWEYFDNNNWMLEGLDKYNHQQNHSLSVGGGDQKLNYLFTGAYYKRDGVLRFGPDDNTRVNLKLNVNAELNKYLSMKVTAGYINSRVLENAFGTDQIINRLYRSRTRQSLYVPAEDTTGQIYNGDLQINPVDIEKNAGIDTRNYGTFTSRLGLQVKNVIKGLTLDVIGWRNQGIYNAEKDAKTINWYGRAAIPSLLRSFVNSPNYINVTKNKSYQNNLQSFLTYRLKLNKHEFTIMQGGSYEEYRKDELFSTGQNMANNNFFSLNYADPLTVRSSQKIETWALASLFGRFNYNYAGKYLLEASYRYDGSSRLAPAHRWDIFPSFSAAWRVSEENFFRDNVSFIQNLKFRASWGQLGNGSPLGLYPYLPLMQSGLSNPNNTTTPSLVFDNTRSQYIYQDTLESPDVTWETVQQSNIGIDLGLLDNRLTITADYYVKKNKNMLAYLNLPNIIGIGTPAYNIGELKSWGKELEVKWRDHIGNVEYRVGFNVSDNQNKLIKYVGKNSVGTGGVVKYLEGYAINTVWGYQTQGFIQSKNDLDDYKSKFTTQYFTNLGPGDMKYVDRDGSGTIGIGDGTPQNPGDLVYLGTINARYNYGFDFGFSWKGFDFSAFFQGAAQRKFLIKEETLSPMFGTADMPWTIHMDRWTPDNPNAFFPRMYEKDAHNFKPSDRWAQDGSYLRLKNIQIGYTVPVKRTFIRNLQVYVSGQDLWESTKVLSVYDPEVGNNVDATTYPFYRTVSFGLNAGF
ncbi:SusC/RagA family TonB-linked outer membrane protein [Niastella yeongjuensis]|uniref:SusC/RagA family TonB-linked outer membrane protein n=1 Tax=Niastella yeongjuensis TaxID=354355 RepID=A0A1V9EA25_9BACT|nr:TonB-dependent receptor [Niastella yeongjuensis]OQP42988.1 SusC/RagA family TonB-linked outer membrane protein [Niastella yeongjuensis]SEO62199.1 TonB-linked outer membrane protein, SusC/RagA family [Niastella yeongjuensis]